jgi:hypothetical protein
MFVSRTWQVWDQGCFATWRLILGVKLSVIGCMLFALNACVVLFAHSIGLNIILTMFHSNLVTHFS